MTRNTSYGIDTRSKVWEVLSEDSKTVSELVHEAGISEKRARKALEALNGQIIQEGEGKKGDPYTYRRSPSNSFLSRPHPIGEERNFAIETPDENSSEQLEEVEVWKG